MNVDALFTLILIGIAFTFLIKGFAADIVLMAVVMVFLLFGILSPQEAFSGFSNSGLITIAMLFIVATAINKKGSLSYLFSKMLNKPSGITNSQLKLMLPVALCSSILNNTPIVAMLIPYVQKWARMYSIPISKLLIPLSYAAMIGGTCTLIGTSTNLIINDMYFTSTGDHFGLFETAWIGIPLVLTTIVFIVIFGPKLLPNRQTSNEVFTNIKEYVIEMEVKKNSSLASKTVEEAGLRHLNGVYLIEIIRQGMVMSAIHPNEVLQNEDRLVFVGNTHAVVDLQSIQGIQLAEKQAFKMENGRGNNLMVEAVVSAQYPFLHQTIKNSKFRNHYGAAIVGISREGQLIKQRIGDVVLQKGDVLLLAVPQSFITNHKHNSRDFLVISELGDSQILSDKGKLWPLMVVFAFLISVLSGSLSMVEAAFGAASIMILSGIVTPRDARLSVDLQTIIIIAASLAIGLAFEKTGAVHILTRYFLSFGDLSIHQALALLFFTTALLTAIISNLAAAVLMFPIAMDVSTLFSISPQPLVVVIMVASSTCFASPIGYQTNLMVYGPGKYCFTDFIKIGIPLIIVLGIATIGIVPLIWGS